MSVVCDNAAMARKTPSVSQQIRNAVKASGRSWYWVAKETGLSEPTVGRFMRRKVDLLLSNAEKIMSLMNMRVVTKPKRGRKKR